MSVVYVQRSQVKLKPGHSYEEYIIKRNELSASYSEIGELLTYLTFYDMRRIYDKVSALDLRSIGTLKGEL